jgi:hypothetical protein
MESKKVKQYWYFVRCHSVGKKAEYDLVLKTRSEMKKFVKELREEWTFVNVGRVDYSF